MAMEFSEGRSGAILAECCVLNLTPPSKIGTGVCFLDHMIDQFTSHGMLGVTLRCGVVGGGAAAEAGGAEPEPQEAGAEAKFFAPLKDYATGMSGRPHDRDIFAACGTAIGLALRRVVDEVAPAGGIAAGSSSAVFCSPLDESFTEASIDLQPPEGQGGQCVVALEPYGIHTGSASGRRWIGRYRTELTPVFWTSLAAALQANVSLKKVRGGNAHHQLESAFKAFARAFRAALDRIVDPGGSHGCAAASDGPLPAPLELPSEPRRAERRRATKETTIAVRVDLDAPWSLEDDPTGAETVWTEGAKTPSELTASVERTARISSGIEVLDRVLVEFAKVRD
jgi:imidazoleglycerol phosphate dehydratase HisB